MRPVWPSAVRPPQHLVLNCSAIWVWMICPVSTRCPIRSTAAPATSVTDNDLTERGLAALKAGDAATFGALMTQSHATERDNYEITVPETDAIAAAALANGALGARQTGGGWGGAIVALAPDEQAESCAEALTKKFPNAKLLALS
ncbi:hypothetical protein [Marivita sp.]|uniref:hypothetical protein n=1 Tax=Marivita sp. TaxID=2003365 RepID=UPI003B593339